MQSDNLSNYFLEVPLKICSYAQMRGAVRVVLQCSRLSQVLFAALRMWLMEGFVITKHYCDCAQQQSCQGYCRLSVLH